jgi:hypothetical protein
MFSIRIFRKRKEKKQEAVNQGWNSCLKTVRELLTKHQWVVDEDDPQEIFCDVCGQSLKRTLADMRR